MQTLVKADKIRAMDNGESIATNGKVEATDLLGWLQEQLSLRNWTASDLAERAGVGPSTITRILARDRKAGPDVCKAIAKALDEDADKIFRLAGLLPEEKEVSEDLSEIQKEIVRLTGQLDETSQRMVLEVVKGLVSRRSRRRQAPQ